MTTELFFYYLKTYQFHLRFSCRGQEGSGSSQQQHMLVWKKERGHGNSDSLWVVRSWRGERCTKRQQETNEKGNKEARQQNISRGQILRHAQNMTATDLSLCALLGNASHRGCMCRLSAACGGLTPGWELPGEGTPQEEDRKCDREG